MRDNIERWLIHKGLSFEDVKNPENTFQVLIKHAGSADVPVEIFEPKSQQGILVIGSKITMRNNQVSRYLGFSKEEKERKKKKISEYCYSIRAMNKNITEDGKPKIGVYIVLDDKKNINQQTVLDAIDDTVQMHEKTARFLLKTF